MNKIEQIDEAMAINIKDMERTNLIVDGFNTSKYDGVYIKKHSDILALQKVVKEALEFYKAHQWQEIALAPKDGTEILVHAPSFCPSTVYWTDANGFNCWHDGTDGYLEDDKELKWMPIPKGEE